MRRSRVVGGSPSRPGPLHVAVERYVRCPRGGLVRFDRCEVCALMQGTLVLERFEVLCAYPEPAPALHLQAMTRQRHGTREAPAAQPSRPGPDTALALASSPARRRRRRAPAQTALIFETDWPDD